MIKSLRKYISFRLFLLSGWFRPPMIKLTKEECERIYVQD